MLRSCFFDALHPSFDTHAMSTLRIHLLGVRRCPPTWSLGQSSWLQAALEPSWGKLGWWDKTSDIWEINLTASFCSYSWYIYIYICVCVCVIILYICTFICWFIYLFNYIFVLGCQVLTKLTSDWKYGTIYGPMWWVAISRWVFFETNFSTSNSIAKVAIGSWNGNSMDKI